MLNLHKEIMCRQIGLKHVSYVRFAMMNNWQEGNLGDVINEAIRDIKM